jgi:predicted nucleotidyltransferase
VPVKETLPPDIEQRLDGLGDVLAGVSSDIDFAYLFGSASTGALTPRSDIDIAIHLASSADAHEARLNVMTTVSAFLSTDAVDVVVLNTAPVSLAGRVLTSRRVILDRRPFVRHQYESLVARMFWDFRIREHRLLDQRYADGRP